MEQSSLDTDIDNYSVSDILDLLDLDASSSAMERNDAVDNIITDLQSKNKPDLVDFFTKAKTKMFAIEGGTETETETEAEAGCRDRGGGGVGERRRGGGRGRGGGGGRGERECYAVW